MKSVALVVLAALPCLAACSSTPEAKGAQRAAAARSSMEDLRETLVELRGDVTATSARLDELVALSTRRDEKAAGDVKHAYAAFARTLDSLDDTTEEAIERLDDLRADGERHLARWTEDSARIADAGLRKSAEKRQAALGTAIDDVDRSVQDVLGGLGSFRTLLGDVENYVGNDLTPIGLDAIKGKAKSIARQADSIADDLDDALEALDDGLPALRGDA